MKPFRWLALSDRAMQRVLVIACVGCLVALALMTWSLLAPTVFSVMVAMSVGQALGTVSLLLYVWVVIVDLRRARVLGEKQDE